MKTKIYNGDLIVSGNETFDYTEITGNISVREGATLSLPLCTTVGGYISVEKGATLSLPLCTTVGGNISVREGATLSLPLCTTVGGNIYVYKGATLSLPLCTTVGGNISVREGAKCVEMGDYTIDREEANRIIEELPKPQRNGWITPDGKYIIADGICTEIVSHKADLYRVRKIARSEIEYLITDGAGNWAHGETLAEAKEDLLFKVTDRKKSDYEGLTADSQLSHEDAIRCYRVITGACSAGTKHFVKSILGERKKDNYTIAEIAKLTSSQYGNSSFVSFFKL